ncbi:MAG TPA: HlyD family efflux transporter periplasmic adaptor subunit, partial [Anaerolineales bacterium]|nr:HlyD family efflux transporter periplasmic adaptor subunit [Anaerolineales bacterium]
MKSRTTLLAVLMTAAIFLSACGGSAQPSQTPTAAPVATADDAITAEGRLEPIRYAEIAFTASGIVSDVLVEEGQAVKKGDPLIRLGDETDKNYAAAQLELANARQAINDLQKTAGVDLAQTVIDLKDATEEYNQAVDYLKYLKSEDKVPQTLTKRDLVQTWKGWKYKVKTKDFKGRAPEDWIIDAENDLALKTAQMESFQRTYDRLKGGVDAEQLTVLEARLDAAEAGVAAFSVTAPFDGVVADVKAKLGNSIDAGSPAITIADFSHWIINTTDLTEIDVVKLDEGGPV